MPAIVLTEREQDILAGQPPLAFRLYIALLARRDFSTGLVGVRYGVSWQALLEDLYVEPHSGPVTRAPGREAVRRAAAWLARCGLVRMRSDVEERRLVFRLPYAYRPKLARNHPDRNPTDQPDRGAPLETPHATRPTEATATRQSSEVSVINKAAAQLSSTARLRAAAAALLPKWLTELQRIGIVRTAERAELTIDELGVLVAELEGKRRTGTLRSPVKFFFSTARQLRAGEFHGDLAARALGGGRPLSALEIFELGRRTNQGGKP